MFCQCFGIFVGSTQCVVMALITSSYPHVVARSQTDAHTHQLARTPSTRKTACMHTQVMRFDVLPLPSDMKARPFTADEQCALNSAMKAHWEATAKPIDRAAPFNIRRVSEGVKSACELGFSNGASDREGESGLVFDLPRVSLKKTDWPAQSSKGQLKVAVLIPQKTFF